MAAFASAASIPSSYHRPPLPWSSERSPPHRRERRYCCPTTTILASPLPSCSSNLLIIGYCSPSLRFQVRCRASRGSSHDASSSVSGEAAAAAPPIRVVFAAGGSGGHIYPAVAMAEELTGAVPGAQVLFIGSENGMEKDAVPSAGYAFRSVPSLVPLVRPALLSPANLLLPFHLIAAIYASWRLLREFRPDVVVGTGGYVSAPVCLAAAITGVHVVIQEQNSYPGLANRLLAPLAKKIYLAFNGCVQYFPKEKCVVSGNPVRAGLRRFVSKAAARSHFFPRVAKGSAAADAQPQAQVVLVLGGSAGAYPLNIAVLNMYSRMLQRHKNRFIIWQTGEDSFIEMDSLVKNRQRVFLTPFLHNMDLAYAASDLVVARAGAMTCTEILLTGKPSIMIPSPYVAEDHQTRNAYIMAEIAGSKVIMEDELEPSMLENIIDEVLGSEKLMQEMSEKALSYARPKASRQIVDSILSIVKPSTR